MSTERSSGNAKFGRQRGLFHQTAVRYNSTDYASHPTTNSDVNCLEKFKHEEFVQREKLERPTGKRENMYYTVGIIRIIQID